MIFSSTHPLVSGFFHSSLENQRGFCHNKKVASTKERTIPMRIRKDQDDMQDAEITLIATVSDALAHPARIRMFRYIMQANRAMVTVCNKDLVEHFDYAQATVSQHMKKLVESGLVEIKKKDKFSYYYVNLGMLMQYVNATKKFSVQ